MSKRIVIATLSAILLTAGITACKPKEAASTNDTSTASPTTTETAQSDQNASAGASQ